MSARRRSSVIPLPEASPIALEGNPNASAGNLSPHNTLLSIDDIELLSSPDTSMTSPTQQHLTPTMATPQKSSTNISHHRSSLKPQHTSTSQRSSTLLTDPAASPFAIANAMYMKTPPPLPHPHYPSAHPESLHGPYFESIGLKPFADTVGPLSPFLAEWDNAQRIPSHTATSAAVRLRALHEITERFQKHILTVVDAPEFFCPSIVEGIVFTDVFNPSRLALFESHDACLAHARAEIKALGVIATMCPALPDLHVPLCGLVKVYGCKAYFASVVMPLGGTSSPVPLKLLRYGTLNGTDLECDASLSVHLQRLADVFNIGSVGVGVNVMNETKIAPDVKIARSKVSNQYYVFDVAHLWSSVHVTADARREVVEKEAPKGLVDPHPVEEQARSYLHAFVRPEYQLVYGHNGVCIHPHMVKQCKHGLSSGHASVIMSMVGHMHVVGVGKVVQAILKDPHIEDLAALLHHHGVNCRYLGVIAKELNAKGNQIGLRRVEIEITARTFKSLLVSRLDSQDATDLLYWLFSTSSASTEFWRSKVKPRMYEKFKYECVLVSPEKLRSPQEHLAGQDGSGGGVMNTDPSRYYTDPKRRITKEAKPKYTMVLAGFGLGGRPYYKIDPTSHSIKTLDSHPVVVLMGCVQEVNQAIIARIADIAGLHVSVGATRSRFNNKSTKISIHPQVKTIKINASYFPNDPVVKLMSKLPVSSDGVMTTTEVSALRGCLEEVVADARNLNATLFPADADTRRLRSYYFEIMCANEGGLLKDWIPVLTKFIEVRGRCKDEIVMGVMLLEAAEVCAAGGMIDKSEAYLLDALHVILGKFNDVPILQANALIRAGRVLETFRTEGALFRALEYVEAAVRLYERILHPGLADALQFYGVILKKVVQSFKCWKCRTSNNSPVVVCNTCAIECGGDGGQDDLEATKFSLNTMATTAQRSTTSASPMSNKRQNKKEKLEEASRQAAALAAAVAGMALNFPKPSKLLPSSKLLHPFISLDAGGSQTISLSNITPQVSSKHHIPTRATVLEPTPTTSSQAPSAMIGDLSTAEIVLRKHRYLCQDCSDLVHGKGMMISSHHTPIPILKESAELLTRALQLMSTGMCVTYKGNIALAKVCQQLSAITIDVGVAFKALSVCKAVLPPGHEEIIQSELLVAETYLAQPSTIATKNDGPFGIQRNVARLQGAERRLRDTLTDLMRLTEAHIRHEKLFQRCVVLLVRVAREHSDTAPYQEQQILQDVLQVMLSVLEETAPLMGYVLQNTVRHYVSLFSGKSDDGGSTIGGSAGGAVGRPSSKDDAVSLHEHQIMLRGRVTAGMLAIRWLRCAIRNKAEDEVKNCLLVLHDHVVKHLCAGGDSTEKVRAREMVATATSLTKEMSNPSPAIAGLLTQLTDLVAGTRHAEDEEGLIALRTQACLAKVRTSAVELRKLCSTWKRHSDSRDLYAQQIWENISRIQTWLMNVPKEVKDPGVLLAAREALQPFEKTFHKKVGLVNA